MFASDDSSSSSTVLRSALLRRASTSITSIDIPVSRSVARKPDFFGDIPLSALETLNVVRLSLLSLIVICAQAPTVL